MRRRPHSVAGFDRRIEHGLERIESGLVHVEQALIEEHALGRFAHGIEHKFSTRLTQAAGRTVDQRLLVRRSTQMDGLRM